MYRDTATGFKEIVTTRHYLEESLFENEYTQQKVPVHILSLAYIPISLRVVLYRCVCVEYDGFGYTATKLDKTIQRVLVFCSTE